MTVPVPFAEGRPADVIDRVARHLHRLHTDRVRSSLSTGLLMTPKLSRRCCSPHPRMLLGERSSVSLLRSRLRTSVRSHMKAVRPVLMIWFPAIRSFSASSQRGHILSISISSSLVPSTTGIRYIFDHTISLYSLHLFIYQPNGPPETELFAHIFFPNSPGQGLPRSLMCPRTSTYRSRHLPPVSSNPYHTCPVHPLSFSRPRTTTLSISISTRGRCLFVLVQCRRRNGNGRTKRSA